MLFVGPVPPAAGVPPLVRVGPVLLPVPSATGGLRSPGPAGRLSVEDERHIPRSGLGLQ